MENPRFFRKLNKQNIRDILKKTTSFLQITAQNIREIPKKNNFLSITIWLLDVSKVVMVSHIIMDKIYFFLILALQKQTIPQTKAGIV